MVKSETGKLKLSSISILVIIAASSVIASEPKPHVGSLCLNCDSCHIVHHYFGPALTVDPAIHSGPTPTEPSIRSLCLSCHIESGPYSGPGCVARHVPGGPRHSGDGCTACHDPHTNLTVDISTSGSHYVHMGAERGPQMGTTECSGCHGDIRSKCAVNSPFRLRAIPQIDQ